MRSKGQYCDVDFVHLAGSRRRAIACAIGARLFEQAFGSAKLLRHARVSAGAFVKFSELDDAERVLGSPNAGSGGGICDVAPRHGLTGRGHDAGNSAHTSIRPGTSGESEALCGARRQARRHCDALACGGERNARDRPIKWDSAVGSQTFKLGSDSAIRHGAVLTPDGRRSVQVGRIYPPATEREGKCVGVRRPEQQRGGSSRIGRRHGDGADGISGTVPDRAELIFGRDCLWIGR